MAAIISGQGLGVERSSAFVLGSAGLIGNASSGRLGSNVYVNAATGNLVVQNQDEVLIGLGPDAIINRTYNLWGLGDDDNGDLWRNGAQRNVVLASGTLNTAGSTLARTDWDGGVATYNYDAASGSYISKEGAGACDRIVSAGNVFTWTDGNSRLVETYDALNSGRITAAIDTSGNQVSYGYTGNNLTSVTTADGEKIELVYSGNNLTQLINRDTSNNLISSRIRYTYDSYNRLSTVTVDKTPTDGSISDNNIVTTTYSYVSTTKRLSAISETGSGNIVSFGYSSYSYQLPNGTTTTGYRVSSITETGDNGVSRTTSFTYDATARLTTVTDGLTNVTRIAYNLDGSLASVTSPIPGNGSGALVNNFSYDANGNVTSSTRPGGAVDTSTYDANGNLLTTVGPMGETISFTYDANNQLLTRTGWLGHDPDGAAGGSPATSPVTTRYAYDAQNRLRYLVSAEGLVTEYGYDAQGRQTSVIKYTVDAYNISGLATTASIAESTLNGWVSGLADRSTIERTDITYDFRGNVWTTSEYSATLGSTGAGLSSSVKTTTNFIYDQHGRLIQRSVDGLPGLEVYSYDGLDRLILTTDLAGSTTTISYNDTTRTVVKTSPNSLVETNVYSVHGKLLSSTATGPSISSTPTSYQYDKLGRLKSTQDLQTSGGTTLKDYVFYDFAGRKVGYLDTRGYLTEYKYTPSNQIYATIEYANQLSATKIASLYSGNTPLDIAIAAVRPAVASGDRWTFNIYDRSDRLVQTVQPDGHTTIYTYDGDNRLVSTADYTNLISSTVLTSWKAVAPNLWANPTNPSAWSSTNLTSAANGTIEGNNAFTFTVQTPGQVARFWNWASGTVQAGDTVTQTLYLQAGTASSVVVGLAGSISGWGTGTEVKIESGPGYVTTPAGWNTWTVAGLSTTQVTKVTLSRTYTQTEQASSTVEIGYPAYSGSVTVAGLNLIKITPSQNQVPLTTPTGNAADRLIRSFYDNDGRHIATLDAAGAFSRHVYDKAGREIETVAYAKLVTAGLRSSGSYTAILADVGTNALDRHSFTVYDGRGDARYVIDGTGRVTEFGYDAGDRLIRTAQYGGAIAVAASYTLSGVASQITSLSLAAHAETRITRTVYGTDNRLAFTIDAEGYVTRNYYDAVGNLTKQVARATAYTTPGDPAIATMTSWDAANVNSDDRTSRTFYDALSRPIYQVDAEGYATQNSYDLHGNVISSWRFASVYAVDDNTTVSQLTALIGTPNPATDRQVVSLYDAAGNLVERNDASGTIWKYKYDAFGQVTEMVEEPNVYNDELNAVAVDAEWYSLQYGVPVEDAIAHYDQVGRFQGYNPNSLFNTNWYLAQHPDVASNGINPVQHFLEYGWRAGYQPAQFTTIEQYKDIMYRVKTRYYYDSMGRLEAELKSAGPSNPVVTTYTYNSFGELATKTDPNGGLATYGYDLMGRLQSEVVQLNPISSATTTIAYDAFGNVIQRTDPRGNATYLYYDKLDRLVLQIDPEGYATASSYNLTDQLASTTRYYTKLAGPFSTATQPTPATTAGKDATTLFERDKLDRVTKTTDAMNFFETYNYNAFGDRVALTNKLGGTTQYQYDHLGRLKQETWPDTITVNKYGYDSRGNRTSMIEAYGRAEQRTTTYQYDLANRLTAKIGNTVAVVGSDFYTQTSQTPIDRYYYDGRGNLYKSVDAAGGKTYYFYDMQHRKVGQVDAMGGLSTWAYDDNGNMVMARTYPEPVYLTERYSFENLERAFGSDRPGSMTWNQTEYRETLYAYDKNNRLISTTIKGVRIGSNDSGTFQIPFQDIITTYEYDAMGNLVLQTDPRNGKIYSYYDKSGRKVAQVDQENYLTVWTLDGDGNALGETRYANRISGGVTTSYTVAQLQSAAGTNSADRTTEFTYDRNGRRTSEKRLNVLIANVAANGVYSGTTTANSQINYGYNGLGQLTFKVAPSIFHEYSYDNMGRLTTKYDSAFDGIDGAQAQKNFQTYTTYTYDSLNNLTSETRRAKNTATQAEVVAPITTSFFYGPGGKLKDVYDAYGNQSFFQYDIRGNVAVQGVVRTVYFSGDSPVKQIIGTLRSYDLLGRIESETASYQNGPAWIIHPVATPTTRYQYNAFGEISARGINGQWQEYYEYNRRGMLRKTNSEDGSYKHYLYDASGNLSLEISSNGGDLGALDVQAALNLLTENGTVAIGNASIKNITPTIYQYDKRNQLILTLEPDREISYSGSLANKTVTDITTTKAYNAFGEVISETDGRGYTTTFDYNSMGRLTSKTMPQVLWMNTQGVVSLVNPVELYGYDLAGRLIATTDANNNTNTRVLLNGSGEDGAEPYVVLERHADGGTIATDYDALGRAVRTSEKVTDSTFRVQRMGYDNLGRMTQITRAGGLVEKYRYDELGRRIQHVIERRANGDPTFTIQETLTEKTLYDHMGRVAQTIDFGGYTTSYSYQWSTAVTTAGLADYDGWVKTTVNSSGLTATETTDYFGRLVGRTDFGGHGTVNTFDKAGRLVTENVDSGASLTNFYYYNSGGLQYLNSNFKVGNKSFSNGTVVNAPQTRVNQTEYRYDKNGNRVGEQVTVTLYDDDALADHGGASAGYQISAQSSSLTYDALNRLVIYSDGGESGSLDARVEYFYDKNGNVMLASERSRNLLVAGAYIEKGYFYAYDSMNRMTLARGVKDVNNNVVRGDKGVNISYDLAGQRISVARTVTYTEAYPYYYWYQLEHRENYTYDIDGNVTEVRATSGDVGLAASTGGTLRADYVRDQMGRVTDYREYGGSGGIVSYSRSSVYNANSQVVSENVSQRQSDNSLKYFLTTYDYTTNTNGTLMTYVSGAWQRTPFGTGGTYLGGVVTHTKTTDITNVLVPVEVSESENFYEWREGALKSRVGQFQGSGVGALHVTDLEYDGRGNLTGVEFDNGNTASTAVVGRTDYINTFDGKVLGRWHSLITVPNAFAYTFYYYANDQQIGAIGNEGSPDSDYETSIATRNTTPGNLYRTPGNVPVAYNDFQKFVGLGPDSEDPVDQSYTVTSGDTLASIAQAMWGDASLWYLLADQNGLSGNSTLAAGTILSIPSRVTNIHNNASTFKVYDPNDARVNTDPLSPSPTTAAVKKKKGCGGLGQLLVVVVAVAVTAIAPFGGGFVAGIANAALGSAISQGVGIATGVQNSFSFKSLALAAISGGVTGGIGPVQGISSPFLTNVATGALRSAVSQGIGVATGLQSRFNWAGVAAAGISAGVTADIGNRLKFNADMRGFDLQNSARGFVAGMAGGIAGAASQSLFTGRSFGDTLISSLPSIIGNTVGLAVAQGYAGVQRPNAAEDPLAAVRALNQSMRGTQMASIDDDGAILVLGRKQTLLDRLDNVLGTNLGGHNPHDPMGAWAQAKDAARSVALTIGRAQIAEAEAYRNQGQAVATTIGRIGNWMGQSANVGRIPRVTDYLSGDPMSAGLEVAINLKYNPASAGLRPITNGDLVNAGLSAAGALAEVGMLSRAASASSRLLPAAERTATQLELNIATGKAVQARVSNYGRDTLQNFVEEISIRPNTSAGQAPFKIRADGLGTNRDTLMIDILEAKGSATAPLTQNQKLGFPLLEQYGGTIVGAKGGASYPAGTAISAGTKVRIIRPSDIPEGY